MGKLLDKLIILLFCTALYAQSAHDPYLVVPVICAVSVSALNSYIENDILALVMYGAYWAVCMIYPVFLFFLPLICYDIFFTKWQLVVFTALVPMVAAADSLSILTWVFIVLFAALSLLIKRRTVLAERMKRDYIALRDTTKEFSMQLEAKNKELMEKQDYEVNLATLNERNRIARDIHDSIGHLLSNSILQTGALMATYRNDEALHGSLDTLKSTLIQGMDSIRESIHDLHDESIDLYTETKALADAFTFCPISMEYDIDGNPDKKIKFALIAVFKEALSNIIKHSDATRVSIVLKEHPALYQLIVKDNGSETEISGEGIGLKNITQRVGSLQGIVHIDNGKGFFRIRIHTEGE